MKKPWDTPNPVRVELATNPRAQVPAWSDITLAVKGNPGVTVNRTGRAGLFERTQPSRCAFVVDNRTGQFSDIAGTAPTLFGKRLRVSVRDWSVIANMITNGDFTVALGVTGWSAFGFGSVPARTVSVVRSIRTHGQSMLVTWGNEAVGSSAYQTITTVIGRKYEAVFVVWVPSGGSPAVAVKNGLFTSGNSTGTNKWQILRCRFTADAATEQVGINAGVTTAGQQVWVGAARIDEGWTTKPLVEDLPSAVPAAAEAYIPYTTLALAGAAGSPVTYRHTGNITGNSVGWPARGVAHTPINSVDRSARLASRTRTFRAVPEEEILSDAPLACWPLSEAAGAAALGSIATTPANLMIQTGAGTAVVLGQDQATPTSSQTGATFAAGQWLTVRGPRTGGTLTFAASGEATIRTTTAAAQTILTIGSIYGPNWVVSTKSTGVVEATWVNPWDGLLGTLTGTTVVNDGNAHHVALVTFLFGGNLTWRLYVDGVLDATATVASTSYPLNDIINVGGSQGLPRFTGLIAHVATYSAILSAAAITEHAAAALNGFNGEATYARLIRYARWAGIAQSEIVLDALPQYAGLMAHVDSLDKSPWDMMGACETVEGGLLNIDGAGNIRFRSRGSFYNQPAWVTLNASTTTGNNGVVQDSLTFPTDTSDLVNDLEGTRPGGATQRTINQASIDEYERAEDSVTIPATTDEAVADALAWRVGLLSNPKARAEGLAVRLTQVDDALTAQIMALEPGSRIDVTDLPSQAPAAAMSYIAEGWEERYSHSDGAMFSADTSAALPAVWTLEDPVNGAIDSVAVIAY